MTFLSGMLYRVVGPGSKHPTVILGPLSRNLHIAKYGGDYSWVVHCLLQMGAGLKELNSEPRCEYPSDSEENQQLARSIRQESSETQIQYRMMKVTTLYSVKVL